MRPLASLLLTLLVACEIPPKFVERGDVDDALARRQYKTVCVGLSMKDEETRRYATTKLLDVQEPVAAECVCQNIVTKDGGWDPAIAEGLMGTDRDDLAQCLADLVKRPDLPERAKAVKALDQLSAPVARTTLLALASDTAVDSETRAASIEAIGGKAASAETLIGILSTDADASARAAAARGLHGNKDKPVVAALASAADGDADGAVRGEALIGLKKAGAKGIDERLCAAMVDDESPEVRRRAIMAFRGTKRKAAVKCLRARALALEEDTAVRDAILTVIKSSPTPEAKQILCDAIPFWVRSYMQKELPPKVASADIIEAQNDRDWDKSYDCVGRAYQAGGYSCYGKLYVGHWFRKLGGSSYLPNCPGYENPELTGG